MFIEKAKVSLPDSMKGDFRIAIVHASWHVELIQKLLDGALLQAKECGVSKDHIDVFQVSGAYELPQMIEVLARSKKYHALIPIGCVIKGETNHFDLISNTLASSLDQVGKTHGVPVSFGIVTTDTLAQAQARSGGDKGNKGMEAAEAAIALAISMKDQMS